MEGLYSYRCCKASSIVRDVYERSIVYQDGLVWQVLISEPGRILLMPKYRVGDGLLYSRVVGERLARLIYRYLPVEVARITGENLDPCLDGKPVYMHGRSIVCDPICRRNELIENPRDGLERLAASLIVQLEQMGIRVYPTGSLLGYYHDPTISDVDLVAYIDEVPCDAVIEAFDSLLEPLPERELYRWARSRHLTPAYYRRWLYGVYDGVRVSLVFAYKVRSCCETIAWPLGPRVAVRGKPEHLGCRTLVWPHIAMLRDMPIVSFYGVYAPLLYEEVPVAIEGVKGIVKRGLVEGAGIIIGVSEAPSRLTPLL